MKVVLVTHLVEKGGGQARVNYELVRHCLASGIDVHVISETLVPELLEQGATWRRIMVRPGRPHLFYDRVFASRAEQAVKELDFEPDLVIGNGFVICSHRHDVNISHFVHGAWWASPVHTARVSRGPYRWYQALYTWCNLKWEKQAYEAARTVVAVSEKVRDELVEIGVPREKIQVIVNGVDLDEFHPGRVDRKMLGMPADVPLGLFCGDIGGPRKNLDGVLKAMAHVPAMHLAVVGSTQRSPYPALAEKLGIADRVHFAGYRRDVADFMRAADFFAFPSRYEACSLVLLEALASGLPVVAAKTTGGSELVDDTCGFVLDDPDDSTQLVQMLRRLTENKAERARLAIGARERAEQFAWSDMADRYIRLFREMTGEASMADPVLVNS
jgi:glycosyltransferase involved in cell wall biosynthesis